MSAEQRAKVFKALADAHRVAIVDSLAKNGPRCGTELSNELGISVALISHHWDVLVEAGLITKERVGQARYCSLDLEKLHQATEGWDGYVAALVAVPAAPAKATKPAKKKTKKRA